MEKRRHVRVTKRFYFVYYEKMGPQNRCDSSGIRNISQGGMCFLSSQHFSPSALIVLEMHVPYLPQIVHLEAKVLEVKDRVKGSLYEVRVKFIDVSPPSQEALKMIEQRST